MVQDRNSRRLFIGCGALSLAVIVIGAVIAGALNVRQGRMTPQPAATLPAASVGESPALALPADQPADAEAGGPADENIQSGGDPIGLTRVYNAATPGVVNIRVLVSAGTGGVGAGAGSGFVLDEEGHIVTNNHVVDQAEQVIAVFFDGSEREAEIVGLDDDSDLAIIRVQQLPESAVALPLADSDAVQMGDWAIAIGNPFGLGSSLSLGVVSASGRSIPSGATPFSIPQAIQTDAAINPGNSGGPLLNAAGQVIGVNAQIRTGGAGVNSGVGFAIPINVVRHIAPQLIAQGYYEWPWLGVQGSSVNLQLMEANELDSQFGAYISDVVDGGPADQAGLRGTQRTVRVDGLPVPAGGDVVTALNGSPVRDFDDLLSQVAFLQPNERVTLTVLRDGRQMERTVQLEARPMPAAAS